MKKYFIGFLIVLSGFIYASCNQTKEIYHKVKNIPNPFGKSICDEQLFVQKKIGKVAKDCACKYDTTTREWYF